MALFPRRSAGRPPTNGMDSKSKTGITLDPDIATRLNQEANKSALINELLRRHYSMYDSCRRLNHVYQLLNQGCTEHNKLSVSRIAHILGLEKVGTLQSYFDGTSEPTFQFLDAFAAPFGIFPSWLKFGEGNPFFSKEPMHLYATSYLNRIEELSLKCIYFIKSNHEAGDSGILLQLSDFEFVYFPKTWPISSYVGGTGLSQILEFYKLTMTLKTEHPSIGCQGRIIDRNRFSDLFSGRIFAGFVTTENENPWWDDFTDIYRENQDAATYEESYGKEFLKAQDSVKYFFELTNKNNGL